MKVPLLDIDAQLSPLDVEIKEAINKVIDSRQFILGPAVSKLESEIAKYCTTEFAVGVSSGTDALLIALMALEVGPGDIVITTDYSFFATAGAVTRVGATPVFIDIDPESFNISPLALKRWVIDNPAQAKRVKAIIPVHLYGQCADMTPINEIAKSLGDSSRGAYIIEDAAQAIGAKYDLPERKQAMAGSLGDIACFSFYPSKNLGALGDGGIVTTSDEKICDTLIKLRNHGAYPKYHHSIIGGNFRLDSIQAAALLVKLPHLNSWHQGRQKNAAKYNSLFKGSVIEIPHQQYADRHHIFNQYVIKVPEKRDELREHLSKAGIGNEVYYPVPFHAQECFANLDYADRLFPFSSHASRFSLALPVYPELSDEMLNYVATTVLSFFEK